MVLAVNGGWMSSAFGCAALALAVAACSGSAVSGKNRSDAIVANNPPTYGHTEVGQLGQGNGSDVSFACTATLVGPREVLTLAHCVSDVGDLSAWSFYASFSKAESSRFALDQVRTVPGTDLAIVHLAEATPADRITPATIAHQDPQPGDLVGEWGFGCAAPEGGDAKPNEKHSLDYHFGTDAIASCPGFLGGPRVTEGMAIFALTLDDGSTVDITAHASQLSCLVQAFEGSSRSCEGVPSDGAPAPRAPRTPPITPDPTGPGTGDPNATPIQPAAPAPGTGDPTNP
jgi:hypothetical protein